MKSMILYTLNSYFKILFRGKKNLPTYIIRWFARDSIALYIRFIITFHMSYIIRNRKVNSEFFFLSFLLIMKKNIHLHVPSGQCTYMCFLVMSVLTALPYCTELLVTVCLWMKMDDDIQSLFDTISMGDLSFQPKE